MVHQREEPSHDVRARNIVQEMSHPSQNHSAAGTAQVPEKHIFHGSSRHFRTFPYILLSVRTKWDGGLCLWPMEFMHFVTNPAASGFRLSFNSCLFVFLPVTVTPKIPLEESINKGSSPSLIILGGVCMWSHKSFFSLFSSFLSVWNLVKVELCLNRVAGIFISTGKCFSLCPLLTPPLTPKRLYKRWHHHQTLSATSQDSQVQQHLHPHVVDGIQLLGTGKWWVNSWTQKGLF